MLGVVDSNLTSFTIEPATHNMSQHIATRWPNECNVLRPTMLRYIALACCQRLAGALESLGLKTISDRAGVLFTPPYRQLVITATSVSRGNAHTFKFLYGHPVNMANGHTLKSEPG